MMNSLKTKSPDTTIYMAPILGVTERVFRECFKKYFTGVDKIITPFLASPIIKNISKKDKSELFPIEQAVIPQFIGTNSEELISTANYLNSSGYSEINWNMGCPYTLVTRKGRGSGLLPKPNLVKEILTDFYSHCGSELSIKMRLGLNDHTDIFKLIEIFNDFPLTEIIIHPRVATQMYSGVCDLESFEKAASLSNNSIVYNGDITSLEQFTALQSRFPHVTGWMIGRGLLFNPFLPSIIKGCGKSLTSLQKFNVLKEFVIDINNSYLDLFRKKAFFLGKVKELWKYLYCSFDFDDNFYKKLATLQNIDDYFKIMEKLEDYRK